MATTPGPDQLVHAAPRCVEDLPSDLAGCHREIRRLRGYAAGLQQSLPEAVVTLDAQGRVVSINPATLAVFGLGSPEEALGRFATEFLCPEDRRRAAEDFQRLLESDNVGGIQYTLLRPDGRLVPVELAGSVLHDEDGSPSGIVGVVRDLTDRRIAAEERQRASRLESLGHLAGGIAHDFNNLLTAILGNISLARLHAGDPAKVAERVDNAERVLLRARALTEQLLTFARGGSPVKRVTRIDDLLREAGTFALRGSDVRAEYDLAENLWAVDCDEDQVSRVIHNLVINADQAMPEGGRIRITARNLEVHDAAAALLPPGRYVRFEVEDTGVGILPEHLDRIFDPYFTTRPGGTGLGLASAWSIVTGHGGVIRVRSVRRRGTTFTVLLPASRKRPRAASVVEVPEGPLPRSQVLVMDDEEEIRITLAALLQELGMDVETTTCGEEALARWRRRLREGRPFDVVILDLTVPGAMGGRELMARLRLVDPNIRGIVSSGYSEDAALADFSRHGFRSRVRKPYRLEELKLALAQALAPEPEDSSASQGG